MKSTKELYNIKPHLTFSVDSFVAQYAAIHNIDQLIDILTENSELQPYVLGGGSNLIPPEHWFKLVLHNRILGKKVIYETEEKAIVKVGGGENWHHFVLWTLQNGLYGLENLSLIPGSVGASPVQNIGAYGVELQHVFHRLEYIDIASKNSYTMDEKECQFAYRDSIFKGELLGKAFIHSIQLKLSKVPSLNLEYGDIRAKLREHHISHPTPIDVSNAVIEIRNTKLPHPDRIPNCGSFFKNPIVSTEIADRLLKEFPFIPVYPGVHESTRKIAAGWLIEQAGLKGKGKNGIYCYENQALVIVNKGNGSHSDVINWVNHVQKMVFKKFGIALEREVNLIL